jgi:hypothetical protein
MPRDTNMPHEYLTDQCNWIYIVQLQPKVLVEIHIW